MDDQEHRRQRQEIQIKSLINKLEDEKANNQLSRDLVKQLFSTFFFINIGVFGYIVCVTISQFQNASGGHVLVSEKTVLALIAGSTAQLGALALAVGKRLWR